MYEIELKAHVYDKAALTEKLNTFAEYRGNVSKYDSYWKQPPLFFLKNPYIHFPLTDSINQCTMQLHH